MPVTGLDTLPQRPDALLVTTRDSRVRLYQGPLHVVKYKGVRNRCSRIAASFSPCGTYVICGSDDGSATPPPPPPPTLCMPARSRRDVHTQQSEGFLAGVVIWRTDTEAAVCLPRARGCFTPSPGRLKSDSFEAFRAAHCMVTVAQFAPVVPETTASPPLPFQPPPDVYGSADGAPQVPPPATMPRTDRTNGNFRRPVGFQADVTNSRKAVEGKPVLLPPSVLQRRYCCSAGRAHPDLLRKLLQSCTLAGSTYHFNWEPSIPEHIGA